MTTQVHVTDPRQLDAINRLIHDHWFSVDDVVFRPDEQRLTVKFFRPASAGAETIQHILFLRRVRVPIAEWWLEVAAVESFTLQETEGVGRYDFNEIEYSDPGHTLTVKTSIPLVFWMVVQQLDVTVRETAKVVEERVHTAL